MTEQVVVAAKIENWYDLNDVCRGWLRDDQVRRVEVPDALVDTDVSGLFMPTRFVAQLGLHPHRTRQARTSGGLIPLRVFDAVRLTVQDRDCICDVAEVSDDCPVIIGRVPLLILDWVVDPARRRLIGNPEHGGQQMIELY